MPVVKELSEWEKDGVVFVEVERRQVGDAAFRSGLAGNKVFLFLEREGATDGWIMDLEEALAAQSCLSAAMLKLVEDRKVREGKE